MTGGLAVSLVFVILLTVSNLVIVNGDVDTGFLTLDSIRNKSVLLYDLQHTNETLGLHRIYPNLTFSCCGVITKILFLSKLRDLTVNNPRFIRFSLWEENPSTSTSSWSFNGATDSQEDTVVDDHEAQVLSLETNLTFSSGYAFGTRHFQKSHARHELLHQPSGGFSLIRGVGMGNKDNIKLTFERQDTALPLLAIETTAPHCVHGFLSKEAVNRTADILNYRFMVEDSDTNGNAMSSVLPCGGNISVWVFAASLINTIGTVSLNVSIHREGQIVDSALFNQSNGKLTMTDSLNVFEYEHLNLWLKVQEGDNVTVTSGGGISLYSYMGQLLIVPEKCLKEDNTYISREDFNLRALLSGNFEGFPEKGEQYIFPTMKFGESGELTNWIFSARAHLTSILTDPPLELQVWRKVNDSNVFRKIGGDDVISPTSTVFLNVYEINTSLMVEKDDVFGVYQPGGNDSRYSLVFVRDIGHLAYNSSETSVENITAMSSVGQFLFPMIRFEIGRATSDPTRQSEVECTAVTTGKDKRAMYLEGGISGSIIIILLIIIVVLIVIWVVNRRQRKLSFRTPATTGNDLPTVCYSSTNDVFIVSSDNDDYAIVAPPLPFRPEFKNKRLHSQAHDVKMTYDNALSPPYHKDDSKWMEGEYTYAKAEFCDSTEEQSVALDLPSLNQNSATVSKIDGPDQSGQSINKEAASSLNVADSQTVTASPDSDYDGYIDGILVPTSEERAQVSSNNPNDTYVTIREQQYSVLGTTKPSQKFFEDATEFWTPADSQECLYNQLSSKKYREIPRHQIETEEVIGSGQFGTVSKGMWKIPHSASVRDVAIKTLRDGTIERDKVKFIQEAAVNGQFHHPNIVKLYGVVTVGEPVMIVLEYMGNGDLRNHLVKMNPLPPLPSVKTLSGTRHILLRFSKEVAAGMNYLSKKHYVHRDLAARNILVSVAGNCKISDFGMSRDLEENPYYVSHGGKIPVKWTAPEALRHKKYSTKSDVWSFGSLLYEIWSVGKKPFQDCTSLEAIRKVESGYRLPPPPGCPKEVYRMMIQCWHPDKQSRPAFSQLHQSLSQNEYTTNILTLPEDAKVGGANSIKPHPQAHVVGAPLEAGYCLYSNLQRSYYTQQ